MIKSGKLRLNIEVIQLVELYLKEFKKPCGSFHQIFLQKMLFVRTKKELKDFLLSQWRVSSMVESLLDNLKA